MTKVTQNVKSAERTLELLETIARHPDGVTFVDLAEELPYPKSSLHGLLQTIVAMGWLTFDPGERRFSVGVRSWEVGQGFRLSRDLTIHARPFLREANEALGETVQLGILDDLDVVYVDKVEGTQALRLVSNVGSRLPAYVTGIGKALLSGLPADLLQSRFAGRALDGYTDKTITSGDRLLEVLAEVRRQGYATDDGEYTDGVFCIAVPVIRANGKITAAISCSVPQVRLGGPDVREARMIEVLSASARGIAAALDSPGVIG